MASEADSGAVQPQLDIAEAWRRTRDVIGVDEGSAPTLNMLPRLSAEPMGRSVYLDLNHWVGLARARKGLDGPPAYARCYELLREATAAGRLSVVLSSATYMELHHAVRNPRQRTDLADVMSELSRFVTIRRRSYLIDSQFEQVLHSRFGRPMFPQKVKVFGLGFAFAFEGVEKRMGLFMDDGTPASPDNPDIWLLNHLAGETTEYVMLRGLRDEDVPAAAANGYDPGPALAVEQERLEREARLAEDLRTDPQWLRRLDDVVWARELYWELAPRLPELMGRAGMTAERFFRGGKEWMTRFLEEMPSLAVQAQIRRHLFAKRTRPWKVNDIRDLDALSLAVPYCDIVATDREAAAALNGSRVPARSGTIVVARPRDVQAVLEEAAS